MKRILLLLCLSVFLLASLGAAQAFALEVIFSSAKEKSVFENVVSGHYIKGRQQAEELLKEDPNLIGANYAMAYVFWNGEGNHLRAEQYMKKTIRIFESKYCNTPSGTPQNSELEVWHQRLYKDLADIYAELDMRQEELDIHKKVADLYHAELAEDAVWALIKLDRFDEARAIAEHSIKGEDSFWASRAYNDLTALEDARHQHLESYRASQRSVDFAAGSSCVVLVNHGRSCAIMLELDNAVEYYLMALGPKERDCITSPFKELCGVYLIDGSWQKAINAMLKARKRKVEKRHVIHTEMEERSRMADVLFAMGFSEKSWQLMKTVVDAPGRLGYDSLLKEQVDMANNIVYYAITNDALKRTKEALDAYLRLEPFWMFKPEIKPRVKELQKDYRTMTGKLWSTNQKLFKEALNPRNIKSFLVPFYVIPTPIYYYAVSDSLGRRTAEFFVDYQESILNETELKSMRSVLDHLRTYIRWRDGDLEKASQMAEELQKNLPPKMSLIEAQSKLIQADILLKTNRQNEAFLKLMEVYQTFPAAFRHFDIKLPVTFDSTMSSSDDLKKVRDVLQSSSRFEEMPNAPFVISGLTNNSMLQICLNSSMGRRFTCSSVDPKDYSIENDKSPHLAEIINNFYHQCFAPKVNVTQRELHTLEGSATADTADDALKALINTAPVIKKENDIDLSGLSD